MSLRSSSSIQTPKSATKTSKLTKYNIGKEIGKGAYAAVKLVTLKATKEKFAMKIYEKYKLLDQSKKNAVNREISIMKNSQHKSIVKLKEVINTNKQVCILYNKTIGVDNNGICKWNFIKRILSEIQREKNQ